MRKYYRPSSAGRLALAMGVSEWRAARDSVDAVLASVKVEVLHGYMMSWSGARPGVEPPRCP